MTSTSESTLSASTETLEETAVLETVRWGEVVAGEVIVAMADGASGGSAAEVAQAVGGEVVGSLPSLNLYQIRVPAVDEAGLIIAADAIAGMAGVVDIFPNWVGELKQTDEGRPCRVLDSYAYQGKQANAYLMTGVDAAYALIAGAWTPPATTVPAVVGVVDSAYYTTSGEADGAVSITGLSAYDTSQGTYTGEAFNSHGTEVANVIGADWGDDGVMGVAGGLPQGSVNVVVADLYGKLGSLFGTLERVQHLIDGNASVINMSLGAPTPDPRYSTKLFRDFAAKHPNVLFVVAAGNEGAALDGNNYLFGGVDLPNVITVGGVTGEGDSAEFSNYAAGTGEVTLAAPAVDIPVGIDGATGEVVTATGTSFGTPQVVAAAAMLKTLDPTLTAAEIKEILVDTAATQISDPAISDRIKDIDPALGGRVLRIDDAVWHVLSERLQLTGSATQEEVINRATLTARARPEEDDPLTYRIVATAPGGGDTTIVHVAYNGTGSLVGDSDLTTTSDKARWQWLFFEPGESTQLTLTRTDTGACTHLAITAAPPFPYTGTYELAATYEAEGRTARIQFDVGVAPDTSVNGSMDFHMSETVGEVVETVDLSFSCTGTANATGEFICTGEYSVRYTRGEESASDTATATILVQINPDGTASGGFGERSGDSWVAGSLPITGGAISGGPAASQ